VAVTSKALGPIVIRVGIDFGGTKIEAAALDAEGRLQARVRQPTPDGYDAALRAIRDLVAETERQAGPAASVGVGIPGSLSPRTGLVRNANTQWLNDRRFDADLSEVLGRPVRVANDANCLALSEAVDGAAAGAAVVFAAILGTGCGGGVAIGGRVLAGANGLAGEWGHTPLPWMTDEERAVAPCWCGRQGCLETFVSGSGLADDYRRRSGKTASGVEVVDRAGVGEPEAVAALDAQLDRLARGLAVIVDIIDPDVIVLGGGLSNVDSLYDRLPGAVAPHVFGDSWSAPIRKAVHGDSSGVRGAAWLWA
jgi:fructokinase